MLLQGITWDPNATLKSRHFPEMKYLLRLSLVSPSAFPLSCPQAHGEAACPCSLEMTSGHMTSSEYRLWMTRCVTDGWSQCEICQRSFPGCGDHQFRRWQRFCQQWPWVWVTGAGHLASLGWAWSTREKYPVMLNQWGFRVVTSA